MNTRAVPTFPDAAELRRRRHVALSIIAVLAGVAITGTAASRSAPAATAPVDIRCRIDPNVADVWTLTLLPSIGPQRAAALTAYREQTPGTAFRVAEDLMAVHGVGPVTVDRLRPYLSFPASRDED